MDAKSPPTNWTPLALRKSQRPISAHRDKAGVPHVRADHWLDALYGLGYLHALDRGTQMLFARAVARGTAAADIAPQAELLETDVFFRRVGLYRHLDREWELLPSDTREQVESYCEGVNHGLEEAGRTWPMWAVGFQPTPWTPQSVLLVGQLLSFGGLAVSQLQNERLLMELIQRGVEDARLRELFHPRLDGVDLALLRRVKLPEQLSDEALELLTDLPRLAGSNAWAVAPWRTAGGHALLASDPHLEVNRLPAIWYEAVLCWDEQYVLGATLPGCPLFAVARNREVAWGVTYMKGDTIDHFIEDCRRGGSTGWQYRREQEWCDFTLREEVIGRKGQEPRRLPVYENECGILFEDPEELGEGLHLVMGWAGNHPGAGGALTGWLQAIQANSTLELMAAAKLCTQPTLCWVAADRAGHIGLQGCGRFPLRGGGYNGLTPIPAWDPANHWQGWLPEELLPSEYDPPEGFLVTANEERNRPGRPLLVTQPLPDWRKLRIEERLAELPQATLADMQELQYDLLSTQARTLREHLLPHLPEGPLQEELAAWDCRYTTDSTAASRFQLLYRLVMSEIFGHEPQITWRRILYLCTRAGFSMMVLNAADRLLLREESRWWPEGKKGEVIRRAAERAAEAPAQPWSAVNSFHFTDRFFGNHQVGRMLGFASRLYPMPGNHATPFQGHVLQTATRESTFAPSYHFVADLGTDAAWTNLPGGPSEHRFSGLYNNDLVRWLSGDYKPLAPLGGVGGEEFLEK